MRNNEVEDIDEEVQVTLKAKNVPIKTEEIIKQKEQTNAPVTIALTATQKQELLDYANNDDRSVSYVVRKTLEKLKIISTQ